MKYIDEAMIRLKDKKNVNEADLSLVERILAKETDPKMACILALDLILVGIDTVRGQLMILLCVSSVNRLFSLADIHGSVLDPLSIGNEARGTGEGVSGARSDSP